MQILHVEAIGIPVKITPFQLYYINTHTAMYTNLLIVLWTSHILISDSALLSILSFLVNELKNFIRQESQVIIDSAILNRLKKGKWNLSLG